MLLVNLIIDQQRINSVQRQMKCFEFVTGPEGNGEATDDMPVAVIIARMKQRIEEDVESARAGNGCMCVRARVKCVRRGGERFASPGPRPRCLALRRARDSTILDGNKTKTMFYEIFAVRNIHGQSHHFRRRSSLMSDDFKAH